MTGPSPRGPVRKKSSSVNPLSCILIHMRQSFPLLAVLLCATVPAFAQATLDLHALDTLLGAKAPAPKTSTPAQHHRPRRSPRPQASAKPTTRAQSMQQTKATAKSPEPSTTAVPAAQTQQVGTPASAPAPANQPDAPPLPATLPMAPPPAVALAPVAPPQLEAHPAPPPLPPISETAATSATSTGNGLRVTFGAGETDLNPASAAAIDNIVRGPEASANESFNVVAYAAGTPDDPSTARRLSLSRALAVRSALLADGVSSSRINVRALGSQAGDGPQDRVDVTVLDNNAPPANSVGLAPASTPGPSQASAPAQTGIPQNQQQ